MALPRLRAEVRDALAVYGYLLLTAQQVDKAHAVFKGMRVLFPGDAHVTKSLAVTTLATGDAQAALALADEAREALPEDAAALDAVRSKALFALGRLDEARAALTRSLTRRAEAAAAAIPTTNGKAP
jgi:predicted Zn-dependent protease